MSQTADVTPGKLPRQTVENPDGTTTDLTYFEPAEETMASLVDILFKEHSADITVGPCIEGAVFEIRFKEPPKVSLLDGYLTVDLSHWHFHLCIGAHMGTPSPELAAKRRVARAAFFETRGGKCGGGRSWGLRLWNGLGEQMTTVFLPNPFLSDELRILKEPRWERLQLWYELRQRFLGEPMPPDLTRDLRRGNYGDHKLVPSVRWFYWSDTARVNRRGIAKWRISRHAGVHVIRNGTSSCALSSSRACSSTMEWSGALAGHGESSWCR